MIADSERARVRMTGVMSGFARWRGAHRRQDAACWQTQPEPEVVPDAQHLRRLVRYVHLNPCRGGLASDPLAWPLSTHRDHVGLGDPQLRVRDPRRQHAYVSSDPSVSVVGTELPTLQIRAAPLADVEAAVGAVLREEPGSPSALGRRLFVRGAWLCGHDDTRALAARLGVARSAIYKMLEVRPAVSLLNREPELSAVLRAIGDRRMGPLVLSPRVDATRWAGWRMRG